MQLKEVLRVQTNAEVYVKISAITHVVSEIGTYIINNAGRQAAQKNNGSTYFLVESRKMTFFTHLLKVYINFQLKKKTFKKITKLTDL